MAGFDLTSVLKNVSSPDTGREQIEYIDIDLLASDANNFYSLDGVDELAANIELIGLQQPIRVRRSPIDSKMYTIVSGHRRCAAIRLAIKDGREDLRTVPCIVEATAESSAMQELRLIYANADTRKMSSADISRQAERVEALLYQLKEEGVEFPGRMRDHVAEACKVSKSKLARLKVIRDNLLPEFLPAWRDGSLTETVAYAIAQKPKYYQEYLKKYRLGKKSVSSLTEWDVKNFFENVEKMEKRRCEKTGSACSFVEGALAKYAKRPGYYLACFERCCANCYGLATCEDACGECAFLKAEKQSELAEAAAAREAEIAQLREKREMRDKAQALENRKFWLRLGAAADAAGVNMREILEVCGYSPDYMTGTEIEQYEAFLSGEVETPEDGLWELVEDIDALVPLADLLGCSIDYLFGHEGYDGRAVCDAVCEWYTGEPPTRGKYYCCFDCGGTLVYDNAYWADGWYFGRNYDNPVGADCVAWYKLPEDMEGD